MSMRRLMTNILLQKYKKVGSLHQVERVLHRAPVLLELLQYPQGTTECVKLAEFKATVGDIIYPPGGDMDLLFSTTNTFPVYWLILFLKN